MDKKIVLSSDSTCDLTDEYLKSNGITIMPLSVLLGEEEHHDGIDIDSDMIFEYVKENKILPKTAAVSIDTYEQYFRKQTDMGNVCIHITISSDFSSCYQNARIAAEDIGHDVYVIDSRNLSSGHGHVVCETMDRILEGKDAETIVREVEEVIPKVDASFILDNLQYMAKGGRCSSVTALGANLLKLKPCIEVVDGKMNVGKKYRGNLGDVLKKYVDDRLALQPDEYCHKRVFITYPMFEGFTLCDEIADYVKSKGMFDEVIQTHAGSTISSHCGPNTLGVLFIRK